MRAPMEGLPFFNGPIVSHHYITFYHMERK